MLRLVAAITVCVVVAASLGLAVPAPVSAISCSGNPDQHYSGNAGQPAGGTNGTSAKIEYIATTLCSGSSQSFSASWVALSPYPTQANAIFQTGFIHCDATGATCVQDNSPFYF